jgi:monoamine oxidase
MVLIGKKLSGHLHSRSYRAIMLDAVIVGAGVSGLTTAYVLERQGLEIQVLESRTRLGGRTYSIDSHGAKLDLGAAWIWPHHRNISRLINELGIQTFPQYEQGNILFETPTELHTYQKQDSNYPQRFHLGAQAISQTLAHKLKTPIRINTRVTTLEENDDHITLRTHLSETLTAKKVVLALPPRVISNTLAFDPELSSSFTQHLRDTPTWMGGSAKALITYSSPFWRANNLSGFALSYAGPLGEIHDMSPHDAGCGVIMGFFTSPQSYGVDAQDRKQQVLKQLTRLFGNTATNALDYVDYAWWLDDNSSGPADIYPLREHPSYGTPAFHQQPQWHGKLVFAGAETATAQGGYLDGAVESAYRAAKLVLGEPNAPTII